MAELNTADAADPQGDPFSGLRASPEKLTSLFANVRPFDVDEWLQDSVPPTQDELDDLDAFLAEREVERQLSVEREMTAQ